jgi:hypothetical protein
MSAVILDGDSLDTLRNFFLETSPDAISVLKELAEWKQNA